jgi:predicted DNA-binding transcriptional regulator AlpA
VNDDELIPLPVVMRLTGMRKTFLYSTSFEPRPLKIGRSTRWRKTEVLNWLNALPRLQLRADKKGS